MVLRRIARISTLQKVINNIAAISVGVRVPPVHASRVANGRKSSAPMTSRASL